MAAVSLTLSYGFVALIMTTVTFTPITALRDICEVICNGFSKDLEKCMDTNQCDITTMRSVEFDVCVSPCWLAFDQCVGFCRRQANRIIPFCEQYICKKSKNKYCVHHCYLEKILDRREQYIKLRKPKG